MTSIFNLISINSRGFNQATRKALLDYVRFGFGIICIQETLISDPVAFNSLVADWSGPSFWSPAVGKQAGVIVLISDRFDGQVLSWRRDHDGRVLSLLVEYNNRKFNIINVYAPTLLTDRKVFFENLHAFCLPADFTIIAGDFNCYESDLDKFGGNVSIAKYLSDFRRSLYLEDAWRKLHPRVRACSWFNSNFSIGSRLDKFFVSRDLFPLVQSCDISPCAFSDHDFVKLSLKLDSNYMRGPGLWKFNSSLLNDSEFCHSFDAKIHELSDCVDFFPSVKCWWDFFKDSIRSEIISFARNKRRSLSHERVLITNAIIGLKRRLVCGDLSVAPEISRLESELKALTMRVLEGSKIRSRVQWLEEGEKPSRFFFKLERERLDRNNVSSILNDNDTEVFTREEVERAHVRFYSNLFSQEVIDPVCKQSCFDSIPSSLSPPLRDSCEGLLTLDELTTSLKSLSLGRSPGSDGLSVEFYLRFWDILGPLLLSVANQCFRDSELSDSMKGSVTRLIYKKRGDIKHLKNWRPISLLNVDYKIISKAITTRLSSVMHHIVSPDQSCSVPGRSIFSNVTLLRDVLSHIEQTNESAILISLDQEKAFDRVDRVFLLELLNVYGFGSDFCRWISTFYNGACMRIILNDWLTESIPLERGVRQGDPLSPLLYVLCVEVLANLIRRSPEIEGFLLPGARGLQAKVRLYADDTTAVLKDLFSLNKLFDCVSVYERGSGAKLNKSKTEAMWLGAWRSRTDEPLGLTWVKKMKILGVFFGTIPVENDNWQPKLNKLEKSLNLWRSRSLSFLGKALLINTLGLSKLMYLARVLLPPAWVLSRINSFIWPFLWGCKIETVARNTLYLSAAQGGIGIINFSVKCLALQVAGMAFTLDSPHDSSFYLCKYFVGRRLSSLRPQWNCLRDNFAPSACSPSPFYARCLETLLSVGSCDLTSKRLYLKLLSLNSSPPILHRVWTQVCGSSFSLNDHWSLVRDSFTENPKNDLLWLIALRGVKVRDSLANWGYINSAFCASCPRRETIDHCFLHCPRVKRVWSRFSPVLDRVLGFRLTLNVPFVFFFIWPPLVTKRARIARHIIKTILYGVWVFRNKATFYNGTEDHRAIIRFVSGDLRSRIKLDHFRLSDSRFSSLWSLPGFCTVENGLPSVTI